MKKMWTILGAAIALTVVAVGIMVGKDTPADRKEDVEGLRKAIDGFSAAFEKGDAAAAAAFLTTGGGTHPR